ncbi:MAG: hypothetical protein A2Y81_10805 [Nitrospirae bacterium RBG_13_43_8]|nr:MAG: hypothetical protein A2Y81_10805 [Nitrospirae bacterium RBG_13_43_8]
MGCHESSELNQKTDDNALREYKLAVQTQMHFNEILMKFRAFGIAVVIGVYSYAITRKDLGISLAGGLSSTQLLAYAGMILTGVLALIDLGYFFRLLLGAVARSTALEEKILYRLTSTISSHVSKWQSYILISIFYGVIALGGFCLANFVQPIEPGQPQKVAIDGPIEVKIKSIDNQIHNSKR